MSTNVRDARPCPTCGNIFTFRSLREHLQCSHLGAYCFFPGVTAQLDREDDIKMTEILIQANQQHGGGPNATNTEFRCAWPGCKKGSAHTYDRLSSLKRHLRTIQREEYRKYINSWENPTLSPQQLFDMNQLPAWTNLNAHMAMAEGKMRCLELLVTPAAEDVPAGRLQWMLQDLQQTDVLLDQAFHYVRDTTRTDLTAHWWQQLEDERSNWHQALAKWASSVDPDMNHYLEWAALGAIQGRLVELIGQIKQIRTC
ncbi:hypothetical protein F5Y02DRAFT_9736 [Annulohypoxylon stygium]|nr:hypothetical protein F5Y02DRAFT_9736 [Annulohypoxylon stygium]